MRVFILPSVGVLLALSLALFAIQLSAQVPGGPTGWGWCAICGRDVYLPTHSHGSQDRQGGRQEVTPNTYSVVWLRNKTSYPVTYQLCSRYDNVWSTYTIQPGKGRYHWYRPFSRFGVVFTTNGSRQQYGLDGNFISGRTPTMDDGRVYDFVPSGAGFDLKIGGNLPYASTPATPSSPTPHPTPDPELEARLLRQRAAAEAILRENAERLRNLAARRDKISAALSEGHAAMQAMQYARAIEKFEEARSLAQADSITQSEFDSAACLREISRAWAMLGRQAMEQGDYTLAATQFGKAIINAPDDAQRRGWQDELEVVQRRRAAAEAFRASVDAGKAASRRGEFADAVRHFEAALARQADDKATRELLAEAQDKLREQSLRDLRTQLAELAEEGFDSLFVTPLPAVPSPDLSLERKPSPPIPDQSAEDSLAGIFRRLAAEFENEMARSAMPSGTRGRIDLPVESDLSALFGVAPGSADVRPLDDLEIAAMLTRAEQLKRELGEGTEPRGMPTYATLNTLSEEQARQSVSDYYLTLADEAARWMRIEWAEELGRLQQSGVLPRGALRAEEFQDRLEATVAVRRAADEVMSRFVERKRDVLCDTEGLLHELAVQRGTHPEVARRTADAQTRLAWEASQEFTAVRQRADHQALVAIRRLTESGLLHPNVPLRTQAERDPLVREALDRYVAPVENRLRAEQQRIRDEHHQRLNREITAIKAAVSSPPVSVPSDSGTQAEPASGPRIR